jgi:hypothetical protein
MYGNTTAAPSRNHRYGLGTQIIEMKHATRNAMVTP